MTLFKKNFSYKRGWQFANKLKLFTLFFVMLTSLIAGVISVSAQGVNSDGWDYYPDLNGGIVAKLDYEGEVACASNNGQWCLQVRAKSEIVFADLIPLKCGSKHADIYAGDRGYDSRGHWCKKLKEKRDSQGASDKPDVSGGKPKPPVMPDKPAPPVLGLGLNPGPASGTGAELISKSDQLKWFSGKNIGFDGVVTSDYQGEVACASNNGVSCFRNIVVKNINFATLKPVKCMVADYNNPQHWCAKVKKHEVFLSLQSRGYYSRPDIDGSKSVLGYPLPILGEPGSVLALSGSFMGLSSDSLSYEYANIAYNKVFIRDVAQIVSKFKIPASCNPSWIAYVGSSGTEVVDKIEATSDICAQTFFEATKLVVLGDQISAKLFRHEVLQDVVNRLEVYLNNWDGVINNKKIYNLIVFLRAYKYTEFYSYTVPVNPALETRITNLFKQVFTQGNGFFADSKLESIRTNSLQSSVLYELIMAQGNYNSWSSDGIKYITKVIRDFNSTVFNTLSMSERVSVARIFSSIFASLYYDTAISGKIDNDSIFRTAYVELVAELVDYSLNSWVASYPNMVLNAEREALRYPLLLSRHSAFSASYDKYASGTSATNRPELYAIFAKAVNDANVCREFSSICGARPVLISTVFPTAYNCPSASVEFHYDTVSTTQGEMMQLCTDFINTLASFKTKLKVSEAVDSSDMKGHTLKMYVYNKVSDWHTYGKALFDLGTSSPGAFVDNYNKQKAPEAHIFRTGSGLNFGKAYFWNAVHEYTHFLEAKYIRKGGSLGITRMQKLNWYEEGLAEYFHSDLYHGRDNQVISAHNLGYIPWLTRVNTDVNVIRYRGLRNITADEWSSHPYSDGYVAVKYLLEEHSDDFYRLTAYLQGGSYDEFASTVGELSTLYNYEFNAWLASKAK